MIHVIRATVGMILFINFDDVIEEFDRIIGKDQIAVFHINDSKNVPGAAKDRHENIGFGHIGFEAINYIVHHADFRDVPKILETPYIPSVENPKKSYAPYKYEIEMLRAGKFDPDMKERIVKEHEKKRLNGVEPSHMPPEGIALSTELQTHRCVKQL